MDKLHESRLLRLAAELLEKQLDQDRIELTESAKSALPPEEQKRLSEKLANRELAEFVKLFEERKQIACLVTLDMGCGNCSMARSIPSAAYGDQINLIELNTGMQDGNGAAILDISFKTIIGYKNPDDYVIGERAIHGTCGVAQSFKRMPEPSYRAWVPNSLQVPALEYTDNLLVDQVHTVEKVWGDFLEKMVDAGLAGLQRLKWLEPGSICRDNILLVVAHPSSEEWARAEVLDLYKDMISTHTGIPRHRILTFSESKAAMQFFRFRDTMNAIDFEKGVLIVDLGASTIDVEYLSNLTKDPYECSLTMAGRNVDWVLGHDLLKQRFGEDALAKCAPDVLPDDGFFGERRDLLGTKPQFEFFARHTKEEVSTMKIAGFPEDAVNLYSISEDETNYSYHLSVQYLKRLLGTIPIRADYPVDVAKYFHGLHVDAGAQSLATSISQSWYDHFETLLRFVLDKLSKKGHKLGYIMVTGGTSNLPGVEEVIAQALKGSDIDGRDVGIHMFKDMSDYESCVPVGSCRYVNAVWSNLDRMKAFEEALPGKVKQDLIDHHEAIDEAIANAVIAKFQEALNWWATLETGDWPGALSHLFNKNVPEATFNGLRAKVDTLVKSIKLDDVISDGIKNMLQNANSHMEQTLAAVNTLLKELANTDYQAPVPVDLQGIKLEKAGIQVYLRSFIGDNYLQAFEECASKVDKVALKLYDLKIEDQLGDKLRRNIADWFLNTNTEMGRGHRDQIKREISQKVREAIEKAMVKHGDFGITERLLDDLVDHIKTALYLVKK